MTLSTQTFADVLPEQFIARPTTLADAEAVAELLNAYDMALTGQPEASADELRIDWQSPNFDLESSSIVVTTREGQIVGTITVWNALPPMCGYGRGVAPILTITVKASAPICCVGLRNAPAKTSTRPRLKHW